MIVRPAHPGPYWLGRGLTNRPELLFDRTVVLYGRTDPYAGIDGGAAGRRAAARPGLAVRAKVGRLSLHRQAQRQTGRVAGPLGQEPGTLFPRDRRGFVEADVASVHAGWRARHSGRQGALFRGAADASAPCRE